jgi:diaminohydroxyphosphoribosylaminopyrimidine deaminase / 5-amino-6-(5-phosphoribosylamino)uracil reductase
MNQKFMQIAIELAKTGLGKTSPNPPVGAVIVKNDNIIGQGFHAKAGLPHAEIIALEQAGEQAQDADMYVTLEPCSTKGKTPPCIDKILESGIKRVFIGSIDPNEQNKNKCKHILEKNNIYYEYGILKQETDELIEAFSCFITKKRPFYIMKTAISLDGRIASNTGDSKWITNEKSRQYVHELRNSVDAILIGKNTLLKDNPSLNVRGIDNPNTPLKIVLGFDNLINKDYNLFKDNAEVKFYKLVIANKEQQSPVCHSELNPEFITDLNDLSTKLYNLNIMSVLIEGGAEVYKSFLEADLIDKFYFFIAPKILGGEKTAVPTTFKGKENIKDSLNLKNVKIKTFENDVLVKGYK